jgi:hypothetical protein
MLILAEAVLEKTGGDSMAEVGESMSRLRARLSEPPGTTSRGPAAPGRTAVAASDAEAGVASGGDD